jgi:hypothetical protein
VDVYVFCYSSASNTCPLSLLRVSKVGTKDIALTHWVPDVASCRNQVAAVAALVHDLREGGRRSVKLKAPPVADARWRQCECSDIGQAVAALVACLRHEMGVELLECTEVHDRACKALSQLRATFGAGRGRSGRPSASKALSSVLLDGIAECRGRIEELVTASPLHATSALTVLESFEKLKTSLLYHDVDVISSAWLESLRHRYVPKVASDQRLFYQTLVHVLEGYPFLKRSIDLLLEGVPRAVANLEKVSDVSHR